MIVDPPALGPDDSTGTEPSVGSMENASQACVPADGSVGGCSVGGRSVEDGGGFEFEGGGKGSGEGGGEGCGVSGEATSKPVMVSAKALVGGRNGVAGSAKPVSRLTLTAVGVIPTTSKLAIVEPGENRRLIIDAEVVSSMLEM